MAGMDANTPRKQIAHCLSEIEETKCKPVGSGADPHGADHYQGGKKKVGK